MAAEHAEIEELYRRRFVAFRNGMYALTGDLELARDAVQEGFARALRDRRQFRANGPLEAWVWRVILRSGFAARRNGQPRSVFIEDGLDVPAIAGERDPEIVSALQGLPPRRRLVVFLRYFADLSYAEIAEICGISEGTVGATLAHAHADLAHAMEGARR